MPRLKSLFGFIRLFFLVESQRFVLWIDVILSFCFVCDMFVPTVPSGRERLCRNSPFVFPSALHDGLAVSVKRMPSQKIVVVFLLYVFYLSVCMQRSANIRGSRAQKQSLL